MKRKRILKSIAIIGFSGLIIGIGTILFLFNMPHRDIQSAKSDYSLSGSEIVREYLTDSDAANEKYLADNGNSKILEITGEVFQISEDFNGHKVVLLKHKGDKAGVSASFTAETGLKLMEIKSGQLITIKGVIRSGASYDEDLEMYENVIIEKCDVLKQ